MDREKVIRVVRYYIDHPGLAPIHYYGAEMVTMPKTLLEDAIALLKAQEPVKPWVGKDGWYRCGGCNNSLTSGERVAHFYGHPWPKYCEECGRAVKWG